jgi:transposase-like protein
MAKDTPRSLTEGVAQDLAPILGGQLAEGVVNDIIAIVLQRLAEAERATYLAANPEDKGNGFYPRDLELGSLPLTLDVPRTRNGGFRPAILPPPYERSYPKAKRDLLVGLLTSARSLEAAKDALRHLGLAVPEDQLDEVVADLIQELDLLNTRPAPVDLVALYYDGKYVEIRDNQRLRPFTVYTAVGILLDGSKRVLACQLTPGRESLDGWRSLLKGLLERGLRRTLIAIHDDFPGLLELSKSLLPRADVQLCIVHMKRNVTKHFSREDAKTFLQRLKPILAAYDPETAAAQFEALCDDFEPKAPTFIRSLRSKRQHYLAFLQYPDSVRTSLSTTNAVEAVNGRIENARLNSGGYFQSQNLAKAKLSITISRLHTKRWRRPAANLASSLTDLSLMFHARFETEVSL